MNTVKAAYKNLLTLYQSLRQNGIDKTLHTVQSHVKYRYYRFSTRTAALYQRFITGYEALADPRKTITVDPQRITHYSYPFEGSYRHWYGRIEDGEWDLNARSFTDAVSDWRDLDIFKYRACRKRVQENMSWEETGIIDKLDEYLKKSNDNTVDGCSSRDELKKLYQSREELYQSLRENGFDTDLSSHCCRVHIGRDGEIIFGNGGRHRLFLSQALQISEVPVEVLVRHKEWQGLREEIYSADTRNELSEEAKSYLTHPDMQDIVDSQLCQNIQR